MRLALSLVCISVALHFTSGQNNDFNFGLFSSGGGSNGAATTTGATGLNTGLAGASPTALGPTGGLQNTGLTQNNGMNTGLSSGLNTGMNGGMAQGMNTGMNGAMTPMNTGMNGGMTPMNTGMNTGMNNGMTGGMTQGMNNGMTPGMNNGMNGGMTQGMNNGMTQGMNGNGMMGGQNGMMNPNGMAMPGQNGMMQNNMQGNGMMGNGMQNGMMPNGMQGNNMMGMNGQNGMMQQQNGLVNAGGATFQDPTRMGRFNGNNLNQLGFDPNSQAGLFQNQLNSQNMPQFGNQQTQFGQGQFGQQIGSPFGQQMPFQSPFGAQFGSTFTSQPGFGMFPDPMMNAFAPNPFQMTRPPMMGPGPMGAIFMPGMEMSNLIFDASGNVVGTTGSAGGLTQGGTGMTSGNSFVFPQPTQTMLPVNNGVGLPGGFGSTTISANPAIIGMGQLGQPQGLTQGGLMPPNAGSMQGMPMNNLGGSTLRQPFGNAGFASNTLPGQMMPTNMQSINSNTNAFSTQTNAQQQRSNSFALNNNGIPINTDIKPFSGIVHRQGGTVLIDPSVVKKQGNIASPNNNSGDLNSVNSNPVKSNIGPINNGFQNMRNANVNNANNGFSNSGSAITGITNSLNANAANSNMFSG